MLDLVSVQNLNRATVSVLICRELEAICEYLLEMIDRGNIDVKCIWFSDEAHYSLDGFNKQNW